MTSLADPSSIRVTRLPETVYLGAGRQVCLTIHRPDVDAVRAVVLVEPFGIEALAADAAYRRLTQLLVESGWLVVRFAPPGAGDSGEVAEGTFVGSWIEAVSDVVTFARGLTVDTRVDMVGLRLGATIAAYATHRTPVGQLVLWAPVAGRAFAREFKLLGASGAHPTEPTRSGAPANRWFTNQAGDIEAGGFVLSAESVALLAPLDLRTVDSVGAERILLVDRDDLGCVDKIELNFARLVIESTVVRPVGYADMRLDDPEEGLVPDESLNSIVEWLAEPRYPEPGEPGNSPSSEFQSDSHPPERELRVTNGTDFVVEYPFTVRVEAVALAGLVSRPCAQRGATETGPAVIMLTTGSNPRCGAGRLQALMARDLASQGHLVVRYDRSGIGVTTRDGRGTGVTDTIDAYDTQHGRDLHAVIDHVVNEFGQPSVVLIGLCSGAYTAFHHANGLTTSLNPVKAIVLINQILFLDRSWTTTVDSPALAVKAGYELLTGWRDPRRWKSLLTGGVPVRTTVRRLARLAGMRLRETQSRVLVGLRWKQPPALGEALLHIRTVGVRQIFIFDDAETGLGQLRLEGRAAMKSLERSGWLDVRTLAGAGHTFGPTASKRWLSDQLREQLSVVTTAQPEAPTG